MKKNIILILYLAVFIFSCSKTKIITTYGTTFKHDGERKEYRKYKRNIKKCNPCWLIQKDKSGKTLSEGYAMKFSNGSHHHYWFGELIKYNSNGDTLSHQIDTNYNLDELLKLSKRKIEREIRKKGNSLKW